MWRPWSDNDTTEVLTEDSDVKVIPETDLDNKVEETFQQTPRSTASASTPSHVVILVAGKNTFTTKQQDLG